MMQVGDLVALATAPRESVGMIVGFAGGGAWIFATEDASLDKDVVSWWPLTDVRPITDDRCLA